MGKDKNNTLMILEFKSRKAGTNAVKQLKGYVDCFNESQEDLRAAIVAPDITDNAMELLEEYEMEFISMDPPLDLLKQKDLSTITLIMDNHISLYQDFEVLLQQYMLYSIQ